MDVALERPPSSTKLELGYAHKGHLRYRQSKSVVCLLGATVIAAVIFTGNTYIPPGWGTHSVSCLLTGNCNTPVDYVVATTALEDYDVTKISGKYEKPKSNGRTEDVQWDRYSLLLKGQRVFLHSGEFHTFRLPVPDLWPDVLQKMKAAGLNAVSLYTHMGLINPSPGVIDLHGFRALQPFFDACKEIGLWVVLRPGPYINAETTAGGIAHWATSEVAGSLRSNASDWKTAWHDYIAAVIQAAVPNQINHGGPIIAVQLDNEYLEPDWAEGGAEYFEDLKKMYHESDIVVPLTYNDPSQHKTFVNGTGAADIYGLDAYPQRFDCSHPDIWNPVTPNFWDYHQATNPSQPFYSPEFQAGAYDPWGPHAPGYEACRKLTGDDFESVFYQDLWAANMKMINYYMFYGGTSWGGLPFPGVYTSYDYGSPLMEDRQLTRKYAELKRQGLFLRSSPDFYKTDWLGNSSSDAVSVSNPDAFAVHLKNPDTEASFYVVRQTNSSSTQTTHFKMNVTTLSGTLEIPHYVPDITLSGRQSKVIVTNYKFGDSKVLYSTASILFARKIGERDVLFLHGDTRQSHEASIYLDKIPGFIRQHDHPLVSFNKNNENREKAPMAVTFLPGIQGLITIWDTPRQLVLYSDTETAGTFWAPSLGGSGDFGNFWQHGTNSSILIGGPYLVREAKLEQDGVHLALSGDLKDDVQIFLFAPPSVRTLSWNGMLIAPDLTTSSSMTTCGSGIVATFRSRTKDLLAPISVPELKMWRFADSLPEIRNDFSDVNWTVADHKKTNIPYKPHYGDGTALYGCDYGFCENVVLWRGHFNGTGRETSVNLSINGGEAFAATVWLNDIFLKTTYGNSTNNENIIAETDEEYGFPSSSVRVGKDNVITVLLDNMGLDESEDHPDTSKSPRGIRGFHLNGGSNITWKIQGKVGGYKEYPDKVRGIFNEGGLFGERRGWHLPGFNTSSWKTRGLSEGLPDGKAGVGFFITTFDLNIPTGYEVPISFVFDNVDQPYRALLFVNGWNFGKRVANLGPQFKFPVPEGILDYHGTNTVAVALWAMENVEVSPRLHLEIDGVYDGGVGHIEANNPKWTAEGRER